MEYSATAVLATLGSIVALWLVTGIVDAGGVWRSDRARMDFIRFRGEWFVYFVLIAIVGGALIGLTVAVSPPSGRRRAVRRRMGAALRAPGAVIVSAWLVGAKQRVIENIAPVLTRVFTPLFTLMILALIVTCVFQGNFVVGSRDPLMTFHLVLIVVLALLLYSMSARDPAFPPASSIGYRCSLVAALDVDVLLLIAMIGRTGELGFSANKRPPSA